MNTDNDNKKLITMKPIKVEINTSTKFVIKMPILCNLLTTYKICKKIFLLFYDKASEEHAKLKHGSNWFFYGFFVSLFFYYNTFPTWCRGRESNSHEVALAGF